MVKKNVFAIGLNEFNLAELRSLRNAEELEFHQLLDPDDVLECEQYPMAELLDKARAQLRGFDGKVDGLIHYIDFPVSTMVPILCREFGLPAASLESVLKCEHKYWSRIEQRKCVPENIPLFARFDPFDDDALQQIGEAGLQFPFWIKPVKSFSSYLGFRISGPEDFQRAIPEIRENIGRFSGPFNHLLDMVDMPDEVGDVGGDSCVAEGLIGGHQCTQEGFVYQGDVGVYATIDSVREPNGSSFARYEYPSQLPDTVQQRMTETTGIVMRQMGYDNAPFNIEYFWDPASDQLWLLEINPRISESHCDLFWKVDGASSHQIAVDLSLGQRPELPPRKGRFACAAKCFLRAYEDGYVNGVPDEAALQRVAQEIPDTKVKILPEPGMYLSELMDQDSYSYTLAIVWLGADDQDQLLARWARCQELLNFDVQPEFQATTSV